LSYGAEEKNYQPLESAKIRLLPFKLIFSLFSTGDGSSTDIDKFRRRRHLRKQSKRHWLRSTHAQLMSIGGSSIALGGLWMLTEFHCPEKHLHGQFESTWIHPNVW